MPDFICVRCGSSVPGDNPASDICGKCNTMAIAKREDAPQAKVTPPDPEDGGYTQSPPHVPERHNLFGADDDSTPSILREHHYSFLRIFVYNLVWVALLLACFALWLCH